MQTFEWQDFFSVGYEEIDRQHKLIFEIANQLYDGLRQNAEAPREVLQRSLESLCSYTREHFEDEERLMQAAGYPDFEQHKQSHDLLIGKVEEFEARFHAGEEKIATGLLPFLVGQWLSHHIAFEDQQYAGYVNRYLARQQAWPGV